MAANVLERMREKLASQKAAATMIPESNGGLGVPESEGQGQPEFDPVVTAEVVEDLMRGGEPTDFEVATLEEMDAEPTHFPHAHPEQVEEPTHLHAAAQEKVEEAIDPYSNIILGGKQIAVQPNDRGALKYMHESFNHSLEESKPHWVSSFLFRKQSLTNLLDVYPQLVFLSSQALQLSRVNFVCVTGMLTPEEQRRLVDRGLSRTMYSPHLRGDNGLSMAVELVPYIDGRLNYKRQAIYQIVAAVYDAAIRSGVAHHIRWHGAMDMRLTDFGDSEQEFNEVLASVAEGHSDADVINMTRFEWIK